MIDGIRWPGGKSRARATIVPLLAGALHSGMRVVSPFLGGAWVELNLPPSGSDRWADRDPALVNFYSVLRDDLDGLLDAFAWTLCSRQLFVEYAAALDNADGRLSPVEWAYQFFYVLMACRNAELAYPRFAVSVQDGGHGNRLIGALGRLEERLRPISRRLQGVSLCCADWRETLDQCDGSDCLFYLDPPYPDNGVHYRRQLRAWQLHVELAGRLRELKGQWLLSLPDTPAVRELYKGLPIRRLSFASGFAKGAGDHRRVTNRELLIGPLAGTTEDK